MNAKKVERNARAARLAANPNVAPHGHANTYREWGCRCTPCTVAKSEALVSARLAKAARLADDPTLTPHGLEQTYVNWGCRCRPCTDAHAAARGRRRRAAGG